MQQQVRPSPIAPVVTQTQQVRTQPAYQPSQAVQAAPKQPVTQGEAIGSVRQPSGQVVPIYKPTDQPSQGVQAVPQQPAQQPVIQGEVIGSIRQPSGKVDPIYRTPCTNYVQTGLTSYACANQ
jgi:hypothetical protein